MRPSSVNGSKIPTGNTFVERNFSACGCVPINTSCPVIPPAWLNGDSGSAPEGVEKLLKQVLRAATQQQALNPKEIKAVNVDTTVQEKAIALATDARLYDKARRALVRLARTYQVKLRQSYVRLGKRALFQQSRYAAARQGQRAQKQTRKLKTYLGRVIRDLERKLEQVPDAFRVLIERAKRIHHHQRHHAGKVYSVHAPEVEFFAQPLQKSLS
jgi:transposase, IS5 family